VKFVTTACDGEKYEYVEVSTKWDKTHKCKLGNTTPRDATQAMPRVYHNVNDSLCPYRFFKFFHSICAPTQERILCYRASTDLLAEYKQLNKPYLYNENNPIGGNPISDVAKKLAHDLGFEDWERCTGQGLRKMGITNAMSNGDKNIEKVVLGMSRHKSIQTSLRYQKPNHAMYQNYNRALLGKHIASPPKEKKIKKRAGKGRKAVQSSESEAEDDVSPTTESPIGHMYESETADSDRKVPAKISSSSSTVAGINATKNDASVVSRALPRVIEAANEQETESRAVSSLSGTIPMTYEREKAMDIVPHNNQLRQTIQPIYENHHHESNHIQRNIILHQASGYNIGLSNYYWDDRNNNNVLMKAVEEKKELEMKVKELELRLASQKEKYDDMKEDLRDAKHRAQKAEWRLIKGTCTVM
jgi:hypothetical protein